MNIFGKQSFSKHSSRDAVKIQNRDRSFLPVSGITIRYFLPLFFLLTFGNAFAQGKQEESAAQWWSEEAESSLARADSNRSELIKALEQVPVNQQEGFQFLIENMPQRDLQSLSSEFLSDNVALTYKVIQEVPWGKNIPPDIFLNDVLPYASATEYRDNWRKRLYEICMPMVKDCTSPREAAKILNQKIFKLLGVKYSTKRRAPDQGPFETMETGVATCTGLSILLVNACRSVGVPARLAGTPLWYNKSGNHTWVEIWDMEWYFTGAAEQNPKGFNRGWFVANASKAIKDDPRHAIYASSFRKTGLSFPCVWDRNADYVSAVNVTCRYTTYAKPEVPRGLRLMVDVFDRPVGERVAARVTVTDIADKSVIFEGISKGDTADMNDHLFFQLPGNRTFMVNVEYNDQQLQQYYSTSDTKEDKLPVFLSGIPPVQTPPHAFYFPLSAKKALPSKIEARLKDEVSAFFKASGHQQANWKFSGSLEKLLRKNEPAVRQAVWESFCAAPVHDSLKQDFGKKVVRFEDHVSPYTVKKVGERPANGWPLFIAMHGGGGTTQEFNDRQWRHMQGYYRDHPEAGGYIYVALRAPDNTWNGFYTSYVYPLIQNLLQQFMLFGDVDPNKKFIMGYSHGGYGAFAIGPKMPDCFAAIHASAAAPADGAVPVTLRNTVFTAMVGEKDTMYGRYQRVLDFEKKLQILRGHRNDIYPVSVQIVDDHPHSGLPDRDKISEMYPNVRNPVPGELTWRLTDRVIRDFFWLHVSSPEPGKDFSATCKNNHLIVSSNLSAATVFLDSRLIDFRKPVTLEINGTAIKRKLKPSLRTLCETMQRRGDPELAFTAGIPLTPGLSLKP